MPPPFLEALQEGALFKSFYINNLLSCKVVKSKAMLLLGSNSSTAGTVLQLKSIAICFATAVSSGHRCFLG